LNVRDVGVFFARFAQNPNTYLAMLGMVTTQGNELLADWTTSISFPLADLCMLNHTFHLLAAW
jgi:hypothetical protein